MKKLLLASALAASAIVFEGCGFVFVARSHSYAPVYCHECRYIAVGRAPYARCGHYDIKIVRDGYYYRPRMHGKYVEFKYVTFDRSGHDARVEYGHLTVQMDGKENRSRR
jgi:hypothetical protein